MEGKRKREREREREREIVVVGWLLNVPATCLCFSGTDLLSFTCRPNFLPHPVTVY